MEPDWQPLSPRLLTVRRIVATTVAIAVTTAGSAVAGFAGGGVAVIAAALVGLAALALVLQVETRRHARWAYAERDDDLLLRRGLLVHRLSVVPYGRLQFVDVAQGPLDRRFGIASVVLHTAAATTDAVIPGVAADEAGLLRDRLAERGEARAAGL